MIRLQQTKQIVGRYAPSPTGDLHLGNLRTALLAWLHARLQGGHFLLRMEDLDQPRVVVGSADQILRDLEWLGLDWDGQVVYQSQRTELYQTALESLQQQDLVYDCFCSRKDIQQAVSAPHGKALVYPGTCADLSPQLAMIKKQQKLPSIRIRVGDTIVTFDDHCLGTVSDCLADTSGDFIIKRADGLFAYQLVVIVDDLDQGVTDVVRGADLLDSTSRQIYLMNQLSSDAPAIAYWHVPLMMDESGQRMAKRDGSMSVQQWRADGATANQLVAMLASSVNLLDRSEPLSATELLAQLSFEQWQAVFSDAQK